VDLTGRQNEKATCSLDFLAKLVKQSCHLFKFSN